MKKNKVFLQDHLDNEVLTLATCLSLKLKSGKIMGFTSHDSDIKVDGVTYMKSSRFIRNTILSNDLLAPDNFDIESMITHDLITVDDILLGAYDYAEISLFYINYSKPGSKKFQLRRGWLGEIKMNGAHFVAEIHSMLQSFTTTTGEIYSARCRAAFADNFCKMKAEKYEVRGIIKSIKDHATFVCENLEYDDKMYGNGYVKFTTGKNKDLNFEIAASHTSNITLSLSPQNEMSLGDEFILYAGCDKTIEMCKNLYNNVVNYRGEPHLPTISSLIKT